MSSIEQAQEDEAWVRSIAQMTCSDLGVPEHFDDAVADGYTELAAARESFDPGRNVPFQGYAYRRIRGAIIDGIRKMSSLPRKVHYLRKATAGAEAMIELASEERHGRGAPSRLETSLGAFEELMLRVADSFASAAAAEVEKHGTVEDAAISQLDAARLRRALAKLSEREQLVIRRVYYDEMPLMDVGAELNLSKSGASKLHVSALATLRTFLQ